MRTDLILVPGILCDETVWRPQLAALADIADMRVFDPGSLDCLPAMAERLLAQAPKRFGLAGHSLGGRIALEVMRLAGERVSALALLDTGYAPFPSGEAGEREVAARQQLLDLAGREGMRAMGRQWLQRMVHPDRLADSQLIGTLLDMIERRPLDVFAAQIRAMLTRPDAGPVLATIRCPTLVLCGREDAWAPYERHVDMAARIPGSELVSIPDCGHMCTLERPEEVARALRQWLARIRSGTEQERT